MSKANIRHIPIDEPFNRFEEHISIKGNHRILFSGKYGTGKTYFLNDFFNKKKKEYYKIHITPTNYVTTPTHNIMQLIKFDIFYQLLMSGDIEIEVDEKYSFSLRVWAAVNTDDKLQGEFVKRLIAVLPLLNPEHAAYATVATGVYTLAEKLKKATDKLKENNEEQKAVDHFVSKILKDSGSPYEHDIISDIIGRSIANLRVKDKKVVLLIDDLDRIDPENIFRILNVFSAYNNYSNEENKFGLDKVILVCDVDNLQSIYNHRYGEKTDFHGYLDKFYSDTIYVHNNDDEVIKYVYNHFSKIENEKEHAVLTITVVILYKLKLINLRNILKLTLWNREYPTREHVNTWEAGFQEIEPSAKRKQPNQLLYQSMQRSSSVFIDEKDVSMINAQKKLAVLLGEVETAVLTIETALEKLKDLPFISFPPQITEDAILALIEYDLLKKDGIGFCFTSYQEYEGSFVIDLVYPEGTFNDARFRWNMMWSLGNLYDGKQSLLYGSRLSLEKGKTQSLTFKQFLEKLKEVLLDLDDVTYKCKFNLLDFPKYRNV